MEAGDIDGDGKADILVLSDMPEDHQTDRRHADAAMRRLYRWVTTMRAYLNGEGRSRSSSPASRQPCFGYTLGLYIPAKGKATRRSSRRAALLAASALLVSSRKTLSFEHAGARHRRAARRAHGNGDRHVSRFSAAYVAYFKNTPSGSSREIAETASSIYYRDGETWSERRVFKRVGEGRSGHRRGDLNGDASTAIVSLPTSSRRSFGCFSRRRTAVSRSWTRSQPSFVNHPPALRIADVDGDGRKDDGHDVSILPTGDETRSGGNAGLQECALRGALWAINIYFQNPLTFGIFPLILPNVRESLRLYMGFLPEAARSAARERFIWFH
jgi:hypothetical protein